MGELFHLILNDEELLQRCILELCFLFFYGVLFVFCLYFLLHAVQRVEDVRARTNFVLSIILMNVVGIIYYYFKFYRFLPRSQKKLIRTWNCE